MPHEPKNSIDASHFSPDILEFIRLLAIIALGKIQRLDLLSAIFSETGAFCPTVSKPEFSVKQAKIDL